MSMDSEFSRRALEELPSSGRAERLRELECTLTSRLAPHQADWNGYWQEVGRVIDELRELGHDLWSHDYDGHRRHLWGWDYMKPDDSGLLQIQFDFEGPVETFWRTEAPLLGVRRSDPFD